METKYIASKPVRFDRNYEVGEIISEDVIDPKRIRGLIDAGKITAYTEPVDDELTQALASGETAAIVKLLEDILGITYEDNTPKIDKRIAAIRARIEELKELAAAAKETPDGDSGEAELLTGQITLEVDTESLMAILTGEYDTARAVADAIAENLDKIVSVTEVEDNVEDTVDDEKKDTVTDETGGNPDEGGKTNEDKSGEGKADDEQKETPDGDSGDGGTPAPKDPKKTQDDDGGKKEDSKETSDPKDLICPVCGKECASKSGLNSHMRTHNK